MFFAARDPSTKDDLGVTRAFPKTFEALKKILQAISGALFFEQFVDGFVAIDIGGAASIGESDVELI